MMPVIRWSVLLIGVWCPPPTAWAQEPLKTDLCGDPLPPGALLRLGSVRLRHALGCNSVAFSPVGDLLASGGQERAIRFWDPATGKELRQILGPDEGVEKIAFSPDGKLLAGAGADAVVYLWDTVTGKEIRRLEGHNREASALAFSAQGNVLAVGDARDIRLWDVADGKLLHTLKGHMGRVYSVALSPGGQKVAGAGMGIWATGSGTLVHDAPAKKPYARAVVFSKDGKYLLAAGSEATVVWETAGGTKVDQLVGPGSRQLCVALSPDGRLLAMGGEDGAVRLWDWAATKEVRLISRLTMPVHSVAFSSGGNTLATGGNYGTVRLWDARAGKQALRLEIPHKERVRAETVTGGFSGGVAAQMLRHLVPAPDGKLIAAARWDHVVMVWDTSAGKEVKRFAAKRLAFSPDNRLIASLEYGAGSNSNNPDIIRLYERTTDKVLRELRGRPETLWFDSPLFLPDSKTLMAIEFSVPKDRTGRNLATQFVVWDVATGKVRKAFPELSGHNQQMALSPDGRTVATLQLIDNDKGMEGSTILLWETASGERRGELVGHTDWVQEVAFSPDGRTVASASRDRTARLWDLFSGKEIGRLEGHRGWVHSVAFAQDGKTLVTGSTDSTALVWNVSRFSRQDKSAALPATVMEACWTDLRGDARAGYRAIGRLLSSPKQAAALLAERLRPAPKADPRRIAQLIEDLDSEHFKTRDGAMKELEALGEVASLAMEKALDGAVTLEKKQRLERLVKQLEEANWSPDKRRALRAVEALEAIGTDEARRLLERLAAEGAPGARLTRESEAALRRLKLRAWQQKDP